MTRRALLAGVALCLCLLSIGTAAAAVGSAATADDETGPSGQEVATIGQSATDNTTVTQESGVDDRQEAGIPEPVRVGGGTGGQTSDGGSTGNTPVIQGDHVVDRTPGTLGEVEVTYNVTIPENVVDFYAYLNNSFTVPFSVTGTDGFSYDANNGRWAASSPQGTATTASITYTIEANTTSSFGGFNTVETTDWALVWSAQLGVRVSWRYFDPAPEYEGTASVDGPGYAAPDRPRAFLGPVSTSQQSAAGQTVTVVTPDAATPSRPAGTVLDELAASADSLQVGDRDPQVTAFVAPDPIRGGGRGGGGTFWVQENSLSTIHLHEYIHTRQAWVDTDLPADEDSTIEWLTEGSADYYQGFLAWNVTGTFDDQQFYNYVSTSADANKVLQDDDSQSTEDKNYNKGRRVIAALDIRLRQHTGGTATFQTVFEHLNTQDGEFSYSDLRSKVVDLTNESTGSWLDTHVQTTAAPSIPRDIAAAYDPASASLSNLTVAGASGSATITEGTDAPISVAVTNTGNTSESFGVELAIDTTVQQTQSTATLAAGATETVTFTGVTGGLAAGSYDLALSTTGDEVTGGLTVQTPPNFQVSALQPQSATVLNGTTVDISADVENTGDQQGTQTLALTVGTVSEIQNETLAAGANTTVTFSVDTGTLGPGSYTHEIASANDSASGSLTVDAPEPATFAVSIQSTNAPVVESQRLSVEATVENTGDESGTQTVQLDAGALGTNATQVTLAGGATTTERFSVGITSGDAGSYTATVTSANDSVSTGVTVDAPAEFQVSGLQPQSTAVVNGTAVDISAEVTNVGDRQGTQTLALTVDGASTNQSQTLAAGTNTTVSFPVDTGALGPGTYTYTLASANESASGTLTVQTPATFAVTITDTTAPVVAGAPLSVNATVANTGDVSGTQTVGLYAGALGTNATTLSLDAGASKDLTLAVDTTAGDNGTYTVTVSSANETATAAATVQTPAEFVVSVTGTTDPVVGDPLSVTALVTNVGDVNDTQTVQVDAGELGTNATTVTLAGNASTTVTLEVPTAAGDYGTYTVTVGSENQTASASARVELPTLERNPPRDRDDDGLYEDVDGNGAIEILDVQALFNNLDSAVVQNNRAAFKFQPRVDELTILDVQGLFNELSA
jgi:hypothetical protein